MTPLAVQLIDFTLLQDLIGPYWQMALVLGLAALIILPAFFFSSPFGTAAQIAGGLSIAVSLYIGVVIPGGDFTLAIIGFLTGIALMALGAIPRHLATLRQEQHLQNLRVLKLLAAQVPKKPKTLRDEVKGKS